MAKCGEGDGGGEDECSADPGKWAKTVAEQAHAKVRAKGRLNVEKDARA